MTVNLKAGERLDELHRNNYKIIQKEQIFCFGMDAVLLSSFTQVRAGETVIDLGTGNGIIPILLEAKTAGKHFTGLEIQEESADLAKRSVIYNQQGERISILCGDIKETDTLFKPASFDVVTSNPPYMIHNHGLVNQGDKKAIARHEICLTLEELIRQTAKLLKDKGRFYMVHRPFRLSEIISILVKYKLEPKRMRFVHPFVDKEPNMVLIEALKGGKPRITIEKPLVVYQKQGVYTDEINEIYYR